tara:strand:- start:2976 stop:3308 length:333 start_codon:yes stop_codon:yes gene_type:complete
MCAPVMPLISAIGGLATAASSLGILGGNRRNQPQRAQLTPPPSVKSPGPAASGSGDDEKTKKMDESIQIQQNAKQKRDKQTTKKGLAGLGAAPAVNTGMNNSPAGGVNAP